ncbi:hypothetical protein KP509_39G031500 [Ceratopteris richardii]|uniref:Legume lectin domain-containing protein n=1 Tax=Ceratopteris richardii TaxID=49495 RepID=A0A8T2Q0N2_CERRI|nr:hypothetical protein KP509_39G031500 [Ceratopteris richardii]
MKISRSPVLALLLLCIALCCTFRSDFIAKAQDINLQSGKLNESDLTSLQGAKVDPSTGTLILNASTNQLAMAFYKSAMPVYDTTTKSVQSFSTVFTFSSGSTDGNGTIAFVAVRDPKTTKSLEDARKTFTVEFNASCSAGVYDGDNYEHYGRNFPGHDRFHGGLGGFGVVQYTNNISIARNAPSGYGIGWNQNPPDGSYFCSQQPPLDPSSSPIFQYVVAMEYNATSKTVFVGSPSCGSGFARTVQFNSQDLSTVINGSVYVGFILAGNATFNLTQWNFTSNAKNSTVFNLALSTTTAPVPGGGSTADGGGDSSGSQYPSKGKEHTQRYIIAASVVGAVAAVALALCVCCLCVGKKNRAATPVMFAAKGVHTSGTIPNRAVVFDAVKPHAPVKDTTPLNSYPNSVTSTQTTSWLQPVAPR